MKHKIKKNRLKIFITLSLMITCIFGVMFTTNTFAYETDTFSYTIEDITTSSQNVSITENNNTIIISGYNTNATFNLVMNELTYYEESNYLLINYKIEKSTDNTSWSIYQINPSATNSTSVSMTSNFVKNNNSVGNSRTTYIQPLSRFFVMSKNYYSNVIPLYSLNTNNFDFDTINIIFNSNVVGNSYWRITIYNVDVIGTSEIGLPQYYETYYSQIEENYNQLLEDYNDLEDNYDTLNDNYTQLESDYNDLQNNYDNLENDYDDLYEDFNNISTYSSEGAFTYLISTKTYNAQHPQNNVMTKTKDELIAQGYLDQDTFNIYNLPRPTIYEGNAKQIWINFGYYENANRYRYVDYKFLDFTFDYNVNAFQGQVYDYFGNEDYQHLRSNFVEIAFVNYEMINYNVNDITNYYSVLTISQEDLYKFNNVLNIDNLKELYPNFNFEYYNSLFYIQTYFIYDINNQELHYTIKSNNIQTNYFYNQGYNAGQNNQYNIDRTQIQSYQNEIKDLKSQINTLQQEINILNGQIETLTNDDYNLNNLMWTIGSVPFESFKQIWNVNFFGVNLADFFLGFVTFFIALFVVKKFFL